MSAKPETDKQDMTEGRKSLTGQERPVLSVEHEPDSDRYTTRNYVRARLERLEGDVQTLAVHDPGLLEELQDVVCSVEGPEGADDA